MIDARGQLCPMPVIMVPEGRQGEPRRDPRSWMTIPAPWTTFTRFAGNNGYQITSAPQGEDYPAVLRK